MLYILLAIVLSAIIEVWFVKISINDNSAIADVLAFFWGAFVIIAIILYCVTGFSWFSAGYRAAIINREYGTNYTREEIFWASDVVETIQQINRERYELNGNLFGNDKPEK